VSLDHVIFGQLNAMCADPDLRAFPVGRDFMDAYKVASCRKNSWHCAKSEEEIASMPDSAFEHNGIGFRVIP
jgi:hypothetical protein